MSTVAAHHLADLAPLLFQAWAVALVLMVLVAVVWSWRGAREDLDHAFRDRSER